LGRKLTSLVAIFGSIVDTIPLILNGFIGAEYHIPFPVAARASFGFYFSRFAVVTRMITAMFWHGEFAPFVTTTATKLTTRI
jgi:cytosine/uracil/thiamine/allantoin permease